VLDGKLGMGNEVEFSAPTHNLLMKTKAIQSEHQENKYRSASIQASPLGEEEMIHQTRFRNSGFARGQQKIELLQTKTRNSGPVWGQ
jgi:hypothetical protein